MSSERVLSFNIILTHQHTMEDKTLESDAVYAEKDGYVDGADNNAGRRQSVALNIVENPLKVCCCWAPLARPTLARDPQ